MARGKQGEIAKYLQNEFLDYLEEQCVKFLDKLLDKVGKGGESFTNRTFNLYDSYAYGIYLNGSLKRTSATLKDKGSGETISVGVKSPKATSPRRWYKDELWGKYMKDMMFDTEGGYKPSSKRGYVIVFAASMPYAPILEAGGGSLKRKYQVISFMETEAYKIGDDLMQGMVRSVDSKLYEIWDKYE